MGTKQGFIKIISQSLNRRALPIFIIKEATAQIFIINKYSNIKESNKKNLSKKMTRVKKFDR